MNSRIFAGSDVEFIDHPKFAGVKIGVMITGKESNAVSVCSLQIKKNTTVPVHTHDLQLDSIYVVSGSGKIYANGDWQNITAGDYVFVPAGDEHGIQSGDEELKIFVHHSPPLL